MLAIIYTVPGGQLAATNGLVKHLLTSSNEATVLAELGLVNPAQYDPKTFAITPKYMPGSQWDDLATV